MHGDFPNKLARKIHAEQCLALYARWRTQQMHTCVLPTRLVSCTDFWAHEQDTRQYTSCFVVMCVWVWVVEDSRLNMYVHVHVHLKWYFFIFWPGSIYQLHNRHSDIGFGFGKLLLYFFNWAEETCSLECIFLKETPMDWVTYITYNLRFKGG